MDATNKSIMTAEHALMTLLQIKSNYHENLSPDPIKRMLAIRSLIGTTKQIEFDVLPLSFIAPSKTRGTKNPSKWSQITYITLCFSITMN